MILLYISITLLLFYLGIQGDLIVHSLSEVGFTLGSSIAFIVFGLLQFMYYSYCVLQFKKYTFTTLSFLSPLWIISGSFLLLSLLFPYNLEVYPMASSLHVFFGMVGPIVFLFGLLLYFHDLSTLYPTSYKIYLCILLGSGILWLYFGKVTVLVEIFLALSLNTLFYFYVNKIKKGKKIIDINNT